MDIIREVELEARVDANHNQKENIRGLEISELERKYEHDDRLLRVYIDPDTDEYYIDTFAAYSIGLMGYQVARQQYESGRKYYKITLAELNMLKKIFKDRIMYEIYPEYLARKRKTASETKPLNDYNRFIGNDFDKDMFNNKKDDFIDVDVNDYKKIDLGSFGDIKKNQYETIIKDEDINIIDPDEYTGSNMKR